MSMTLMAKAMSIKVGNPLRKLVLIKLADNASDNGECWPSYQHIADQCEVSKSTVRKHIKDLCDSGLVRIENRKGPKGNSSNLYHLTLNAVPSDDTPPVPSKNIGMPSDDTPPVPSDDTRTSHSFEPAIEPIKNNKKSVFDFSCWPAMPSKQTLHDWLAMRRRMKANVNQTVINRFAGQLKLAVAAGVSVDDCLAECVVRNWRGFEFAWMQNANRVGADAAGWHKDLGRF